MNVYIYIYIYIYILSTVVSSDEFPLARRHRPESEGLPLFHWKFTGYSTCYIILCYVMLYYIILYCVMLYDIVIRKY